MDAVFYDEVEMMGRSKTDWYGSVKGFIMRYYHRKRETEIQIRICDNIDNVLRETEQMEHGQDRIKAVNMILLNKTHTIDGVAIELHYGRRTIQRWISDFVKEVGKRSGF